MRLRSVATRHITILSLAVLLSLGFGGFVHAQSQEPKPVLLATPVASGEATPTNGAPSGVTGSSWTGPNWGVGVSWDPADWTVEAEFVDTGYDGLQLGTPLSTVYLQVYERFGGDAAACLANAEAELAQRDGVAEVATLTGRQLPVSEERRGEALLFGLTLILDDGTVFRGVEYIECRTIVPGSVVLELKWQTITETFNEDLPRVEALFETIAIPETAPPIATPVA